MKTTLLGSISAILLLVSNVSFSQDTHQEPPIFAADCKVAVYNPGGQALSLENRPTCTEIFELLKTPALPQAGATVGYMKAKDTGEVDTIRVTFDRKVSSAKADEVLNTLQLGPELQSE